MQLRHFLSSVLLFLLLAASNLYAAGTPGKFDYYLMSLSWSPDFCAYLESQHRTDPAQCALGKKLGFVLHGVWPQYIKGYPSDCSTEKLSATAIAKFPNLYPNESLAYHEWEKHGTCSGLTPENYLSLSQQFKTNLKIPTNYVEPINPFRTTIDALKKDFIAANPTLSGNSLAPACSGSGRFLQELRVCFSKEGKPMACSAEVVSASKKSCAQLNFLVRNVK